MLNEERIAGLVGQEVRLAVSSAVDAQLGGLVAPAEGALSSEQWQALGKRLTGMEQQLQVVIIVAVIIVAEMRVAVIIVAGMRVAYSDTCLWHGGSRNEPREMHLRPQEMATTQASVAGALSTASLSGQLAEVKAELSIALQQLSSGEQGGGATAVRVKEPSGAWRLNTYILNTWCIQSNQCAAHARLNTAHTPLSVRVNRGWSSCRHAWPRSWQPCLHRMRLLSSCRSCEMPRPLHWTPLVQRGSRVTLQRPLMHSQVHGVTGKAPCVKGFIIDTAVVGRFMYAVWHQYGTSQTRLTPARIESSTAAAAPPQPDDTLQKMQQDLQALGTAVQALTEQLSQVQAVGAAVQALAVQLQDTQRSVDALGQTRTAEGQLEGVQAVPPLEPPSTSKDEAYQAMQVACTPT